MARLEESPPWLVQGHTHRQAESQPCSPTPRCEDCGEQLLSAPPKRLLLEPSDLAHSSLGVLPTGRARAVPLRGQKQVQIHLYSTKWVS